MLWRLFIICALLLGLTAIVTAQDDETGTDMLQAGDRRVDEFGISQVYVPAGCFMMGTSETEAEYASTLDAPDWAVNRLPTEQPQREVCITQGYWIDEFEVTNEAYEAFVEAGGYENQDYWSAEGWQWLSDQRVNIILALCSFERRDPQRPRVCINWYQAEAYANWRGGHLPTEAQWEYAARGPESLIYPWGNEWNPELANILDALQSEPVGSYPDGVSWVGAHDMAGNAMEWVQDWLADDYSELLDQTEDPTGPEFGTIRIEKGGWWGSNPVVARSAYRHFEDPPTYQDDHIGFRVVTEIPVEETADD